MSKALMESLLALPQQWSGNLDSCIAGSDNEQILAALKVFNAVSTSGGGPERKAAFDAFPWDNKSLQKLPYMRRRAKESKVGDILVRPDIRTCYVLFVLSMVDKDSATSVKTAFLEQRRNVFLSIFKGLFQDHYTVIQKVLRVCWEGIWSDPKIRRTTKLGLFSEVTISHLLKLYDRSAPEASGGEHVPADVVHHFLLAICTRPGQGICFRDRGWYSRDADEDCIIGRRDDEDTRHSGKTYNKILANILRTLKVNEDSRQQELALKITTACPELVAGYWSAASLTLEPRLSSKWIANIAFAGQVLSQAVPVCSFFLPGSNELYNPTPPPLSTIMANVLPPVGTKALFTKGLQATSTPIVQHCTALVLSKCLRKLTEVLCTFKVVADALEEDEEQGQWSRQRREIEKEARRRVPEFQVIVAFSQQPSVSLNATKHALLSESSQRLLWLYQKCFPDVVADARFEVGKLILNLVEGSLAALSANHEDDSSERECQPNEVSTALQSAKYLHVLRLLSDSDQFAWVGKVASSSHTYLYVLLSTFCNTRVRALRSTLKDLLRHILSESVLFQDDPNEVEMWIAALPFDFVRRGQGIKSPDGAPLTDEVDAVVAFLDDCAQRCLKTPYRYMETMSVLAQSTSDIHQESFASPLLMTVHEQLLAKASGKLMTPSDTLAIVTFVRRLLVQLAAKQDDCGYFNLVAILDRLDSGVASGQPFPYHPSICFGIKRELSIARACLRRFQDEACCITEGSSDKTTGTFLELIEQTHIPSSESARITSAFELVDWIRLADVSLSSADVSRLASAIRQRNEHTLWALINYLHPHTGHLWNPEVSKLLHGCPQVDGAFSWIYSHCTPLQLQDKQARSKLLGVLYTHPVTLVHVENAIRLIIHDISVSTGRHKLTAALLSLLTDVMIGAKDHFNEKGMRQLKATVIQRDAIQEFFVSRDIAVHVHQAIGEFVAEIFDPNDAEDKALLSSISSHWVELMTKSLSSTHLDNLGHVRPWVKFMDTEDLLVVVDLLLAKSGQNVMAHEMLEDILCAIWYRTARISVPKIPVQKILELQALLPRSATLGDMLSATLASQLPSGFDGQADFIEGEQLSAILSRTKLTLTCPSNIRSLPLDLLSQLLEKEPWTDSTRSAISTLLYSNETCLRAYATWLNSKRWTRLSVHIFAPVLMSFLDCTTITNSDLSLVNEDVLHGLLNQLFPGERSHESAVVRCIECIHKILELSGFRRTRLVVALQERIQCVPIMDLAFELTFLARKLGGVCGYDALSASVVDRALQWAVRHLSDDAADSNMALENLRHVVTRQEVLKSHLVEPFLTIAIQHRLSDVNTLELAVDLVNRTPLKPVVVNRLLQKVLQHQHFVEICGRYGSRPQRNQVIRFLDAIFRLHPTNTCQPSHVEPLFQIYGGTMSSSDRRLLSIMRLFEEEKRSSLSAFSSRWSPSPDSTASDALGVVQNLDPVYVLRTCLAFPSWRRFEEEKCASDGPGDDSMYDPLMVIVLSAQMLAQCPPTTPLGWVKVFRSNIVSLLIRCLSSKDPNIRETALCQIGSIWESMQKSDMHEAPQVLYVLRLLKNAIYPPAKAHDPPRRLATFTTLILLHALRGIFYPSNFIYPRTARFLLQRPELDVSDVPMLFGMLYSSSDEWKKERGWMLRMLGDGMASTDDWKVLKRRHTWDLLASLFQSSRNDSIVRISILDILANVTCNPQACTSLILKSSLLSWIEMQVEDSPRKELIAWFRILENILAVADTSKLSRATDDQWCSTICKCLSCLLNNKDKDLGVLRQGVAVTLRLSMISGVPRYSLERTLSHAVAYLQHLEPGIQLHGVLTRPVMRSLDALALPPHRAQGLHDLPATVEQLRVWGEIVEALWRVAMSLDNVTHAWEALTRRLLVLRALVGEEASEVGEWARKEVVRALCAVS